MKKIIISVLSVILILGACKKVDFGDLNDNPNGAKEAQVSSLMGGAMMRYSSSLTGRTYLTVPTLYVQYQSQVVYTDEMLYNTEPRSWYSYYIQTLSNLQEVIETNEAAGATPSGSLISQGFPANQIAVSKIMQSVIFKRLTDTYGDIPYSKALDPSVVSPAYDAQEDVYKGMIETVKTARNNINVAKTGPTGDVIYNGNMGSWVKFANSFIMSLSIQLSKRYPAASGYAATEFKAALNHAGGAIEAVADEAWFHYDVANGFENPWNANRTPDYMLSKELTDALHGNSGDGSLNPTSNTAADSRINIYSSNPAADGLPYGHSDGSGGVGMSSSIWGAAPPLPLLTAAYTYLNRAEAASLGWTSEDANAMLSSGIVASYTTLSNHYGTDITADATGYATARVADVATAAGGALQVIGEEKWVALFPLGFDAWSEHRRTGFPALVPAVDALNDGNIPTRYIYPSEESSLNPTSYASGVSSLTPAEDKNTARVWWDVN